MICGVVSLKMKKNFIELKQDGRCLEIHKLSSSFLIFYRDKTTKDFILRMVVNMVEKDEKVYTKMYREWATKLKDKGFNDRQIVYVLQNLWAELDKRKTFGYDWLSSSAYKQLEVFIEEELDIRSI